MSDRSDQMGRLLISVVGVVGGALVAWLLFVEFAADMADVLGIILVFVIAGAGLRLASSFAESTFPRHNVAEVSVKGPITRNDGGTNPIPTGPAGATADDIVEQVEKADDDPAAEALLVHLNTPGGEVVPSDDIRNAVESFDGPTVAYTTDVCASGGYWIAAGCDELWARDLSVVGSIGVIGSRPNLADLAERLGVSYEQFTAGEYKDAGTPLKEIEPEEREYLQGIIDDLYGKFVNRVSEGRELTVEEIRETEARVYLGDDAAEVGLVDSLGTKDDVKEQLETELGEAVTVREFEPQRGPLAKMGMGAKAVAYAFGAGLASRIDSDGLGFEFRT